VSSRQTSCLGLRPAPMATVHQGLLSTRRPPQDSSLKRRRQNRCFRSACRQTPGETRCLQC
jgi:hypothetical protein